MNGAHPLLFAVFDEACTGLRPHGLWRHPENLRARVDDLDAWTRRAVAAEEAGFHALFLADVLGLYDVHGGGHAAAVREGVEAPVLDPLVLIAALAARTSRLSFVLTASTTYEAPFALARRLSTLDALSGGRIAWNVVTSYLESAARNFGMDGQLDHGERYARAEEFLEVCYALWERSWEDAAVERMDGRVTALHPERVHPVEHRGERYAVAGPHLVAPTPQRTPVIAQAGASGPGTAFAGRHAELVFTPPGPVEQVAERVRGLRTAAEAAGRDPAAVRPLLGVMTVVARTEAAAHARLEELERWHRPIGNEISHAASTGIDLAAYPDDAPYPPPGAGGSMRSALGQYTRAGGTRFADVRASLSRFGNGTELLVGTGEQVADRLESLAAATGVDGFLVYPPIQPGSVDELGEHVLPVLGRRGRFEPPAAGRTLREQLGGAPRLPASHPALRHPDAPSRKARPDV